MQEKFIRYLAITIDPYSTQKSLEVVQKNIQKWIEVVNSENLGEYIEKSGQPDSALLYENKACQLNRLQHEENIEQVVLNNLAKIQASMSNDDLATSYFKKSLLLFPQIIDFMYSSKAQFTPWWSF